MPATDDSALSPVQRIRRIALVISLPAIFLIGILPGAGPTNAQSNSKIEVKIKLKAICALPGTLPQDKMKCWADFRKDLQEARGDASREAKRILKAMPAYCSQPLGKTSKRVKICDSKI